MSSRPLRTKAGTAVTASSMRCTPGRICGFRHQGTPDQPRLGGPAGTRIKRHSHQERAGASVGHMRATVMYGAGDVRVETVPDARLVEPTDAVVSVTRAAICGSDLWPYQEMERDRNGRRMG